MIEFAGITLLCEDTDGKLQRVLRPQPCDWSHYFVMPDWDEPQWGDTGLPKPIYSQPLDFEFNTLYWPTGAGRWGMFVGLADKSRALDVLAACTDQDGHPVGKLLTIGDGTNTVSVTMFCLGPRYLVGTEELVALPLVDARYYWQWLAVEDYTPADWDAAFADLPITVTAPTVDAAYGIPDTESLHRYTAAVPGLIDAISHSVGARFVATPSGYVVETPSDADTTYQANRILANAGYRLTGSWNDELLPGSLRPDTIDVVFRKWKHFHAITHGEKYHLESVATDPQTPAIQDRKLQIWTTAFAEYADGADCSEDDTHENSEDTETLADKIAADYLAWLARRHDVTFAGILPWTPTGFDDFIVWTVATGPHRRAFTRICSHPPGFGQFHQLQQFTGLRTYGPIVRAVLTEALEVDSTASATITERNCNAGTSTWENTSDTIEVHDNGTALADASVVNAYWDEERSIWVPISGGGGCTQNEIQQVTIFGSPTGGTFDLYFDDEAVELNYDDTSTEVQTALEGHSGIASGDVTVTGGPLPNATITIEFTGNLANTNVPIMVADWGSLTGGTGVGVLISVSQPGAPNDFA